MREIGRFEKEAGVERGQRYANFRITPPLVPGDAVTDTIRRMRRKLGNVLREDDTGTIVRNETIGSLTSSQSHTTASRRLRLFRWVLSRRLDTTLWQGICKKATEDNLNDYVLAEATQAFMRKEHTLGLPGVAPRAINLTGSNSTKTPVHVSRSRRSSWRMLSCLLSSS